MTSKQNNLSLGDIAREFAAWCFRPIPVTGVVSIANPPLEWSLNKFAAEIVAPSVDMLACQTSKPASFGEPCETDDWAEEADELNGHALRVWRTGNQLWVAAGPKVDPRMVALRLKADAR